MKLTKEEKERSLQERRQRKYNETHKMIDNICYKFCSICEEWFPSNEEYFYKNKSSKIDGLHPYCKSCTSKKSRKWALENPEKVRESTLKFAEENKDRRRIVYRLASRKSSEKGLRKIWRQNNKHKLTEYRLKREAHKKHDITDEEWENCKNYFNYRCAYCGLAIESHWITYRGKLILGDFHREHVDDNGANDLSNCVPSCKSCNNKKRVFTLEEWFNINDVGFNHKKLNKIHKWLNEAYKLYIDKNK